MNPILFCVEPTGKKHSYEIRKISAIDVLTYAWIDDYKPTEKYLDISQRDNGYSAFCEKAPFDIELVCACISYYEQEKDCSVHANYIFAKQECDQLNFENVDSIQDDWYDRLSRLRDLKNDIKRRSGASIETD